MLSISAIIITRNEEKNIERCIQSLRSVVEEIIVVDSISTDATKSICEQHNVVFIEQTFLGYAEQKNFGASKAKNDWLLFIDADEALSNELKTSISEIREKGTNDTVFSFNRLNNYRSKWIKHSGWYPDKKIRLWHKDAAKWGGAQVHESVDVADNQNVAFLKGDLLHYPFLTAKEHWQKAKKYADIAANDLKKTSVLKLFFKWCFSPSFRFWKMFIFSGGFLDGINGFLISSITAYEVFLKYSKAIINR